MRHRVMKNYLAAVVLLLPWLLTAGCDSGEKDQSSEMRTENNTLTEDEKMKGWKLLFDGKTLDGWRAIGSATVPEHLWRVEDGSIRKVNTGEVASLSDGQPAEGGDLMTVDTYDNFDLRFEWKVSESGNTGLKYNVSEEMSTQYLTGHSAIGFEYQLCDDDVADNSSPTHRVGALYDLIPAGGKVTLRPPGEYNSSRILVNGNHVEHWLNGIRIVEFEFGSARLDSLYRISKYKDYTGFQQKRKGHIVLQNHKDDAWFRNIRIRESGVDGTE